MIVVKGSFIMPIGKTKGGMSVADMKKRREDMLKIKTQKVPKNRIVNIVPSAARILNRLGTNGGIAILCGNYVKTGNHISYIIIIHHNHMP